MTELPRAVADTNPVGRHGVIGVDVLPREIIYPRFENETDFDRASAMLNTGVAAVESTVTVSDQSLPSGLEKPVEAPGLYL